MSFNKLPRNPFVEKYLSAEAIHELFWIPGPGLVAQEALLDQIFHRLVDGSFHLWKKSNTKHLVVL